MWSLAIVLLASVGIAVAQATTQCQMKEADLTAATTTIKKTVQNLPGNMMAGNCMINITYNDTTGNLFVKINTTLIYNGTAAMAAPTGSNSRRKRQSDATNGCSLWLINPKTCTHKPWAKYLNPSTAPSYLSVLRPGAVVFGIGAHTSNTVMDAYMTLDTMLAIPKTAKNMKTPLGQAAKSLLNPFLIVAGYPEKTIALPFMSGSSVMGNFCLMGNVNDLNVMSMAP